MSEGPTTNQRKPDKLAFAPAQSDLAYEFKAGDVIGGAYEIIDLLGQGGMGNIYRARHNIMMEEYALKTLRADAITDVSWKRFQKEAQAIGRMNHQNIVAIYNFGLHDGKVPYYVMAQLQGKTLLEIIAQRGPLPVEEALPIFIEVCNGMGYAHKKGVIHRDLKPPNVVVLDTPQAGSKVKIVDFGIVKLSDDGGNQQLTNIGEVCGSPYYMSPEQCEAGAVDARSDIYSIGCTLYEILTGAPPFRGRNVVDTMLKHQSAPPPPLQSPGGKPFPPMLERILQKMLAKRPDQRYQTMEEAAQDLQAVLDGKDLPLSGQQAQPQRQAPPQASAPRSAASDNYDRGGALLLEESGFHEQQRDHRPSRRNNRASQADHEEDEEYESEFQTSMPPYFLRLMIGVFVVLTVLMAAMGYYWIQSKPASRPSSPVSLQRDTGAPPNATPVGKA
ncbi:MAG: serine/threonine protein kinase [Cyanobacteria bacterium SZAS LIN-2]|nr:serine/threonine protein kinase [Cyanobacteria bacterium SZAS LIN-3]MBS1998417.1 serine/threonine protein kinase [Cyanobacteria bacterium SZAS LIN-2]